MLPRPCRLSLRQHTLRFIRCRVAASQMHPSSWFERLFGFSEGRFEETRSLFVVRDNTIAVDAASAGAPGKSWCIGNFLTPTLASLRDESDHLRQATRKLCLSVVIGDVTQLLSQPENRWATFQVASQFNCLEFPDPDTTPEDGISDYDTDRTQGPACSIACGPATVYRNYFVPVKASSGAVSQGQRAEAQLNNADELLAACHPAGAGVTVRNGYMRVATAASLESLNAFLAGQDRQTLMLKLKVGVHSDVQVCSVVPVQLQQLCTTPERCAILQHPVLIILNKEPATSKQASRGSRTPARHMAASACGCPQPLCDHIGCRTCSSTRGDRWPPHAPCSKVPCRQPVCRFTSLAGSHRIPVEIWVQVVSHGSEQAWQ